MKAIFDMLITTFTAVVLIALAPFVFFANFVLDIMDSRTPKK